MFQRGCDVLKGIIRDMDNTQTDPEIEALKQKIQAKELQLKGKLQKAMGDKVRGELNELRGKLEEKMANMKLKGM